MIIRDIKKSPRTRVMDNSFLCELLHPKNEGRKVATRYSLSHAIVSAGEVTLPHALKTATEVYYILGGEGMMYIDGDSAPVHPGQAVYIPAGAVQYIENTGQEDLVFLAIVDPMWSPEDEVLISSDNMENFNTYEKNR